MQHGMVDIYTCIHVHCDVISRIYTCWMLWECFFCLYLLPQTLQLYINNWSKFYFNATNSHDFTYLLLRCNNYYVEVAQQFKLYRKLINWISGDLQKYITVSRLWQSILRVVRQRIVHCFLRLFRFSTADWLKYFASRFTIFVLE